jgi:hypothetical protein
MNNVKTSTLALVSVLASSVNSQGGEPCNICPKGVTHTLGDDFAPYTDSGDTRTCAEMIQGAANVEIGTRECGYYEIDEAICCFTEPEIPCKICPDGATVADDYVPEDSFLRWPCSFVIESAKRFESKSDACELHEIDEENCCPSVTMTTSPNPNPNTVPPAINVSTTPGTVPAIDELLYDEITTIQAEDYQIMEGVEFETTADEGGGSNAAGIDTDDWMTFEEVTIPSAGTYKVEYRVASLSGGGVLRFEKAGGTPAYGSIAIPATGGWQNWITMSHTVDLEAGPQFFAIAAIDGGWNLNWFRIMKPITDPGADATPPPTPNPSTAPPVVAVTPAHTPAPTEETTYVYTDGSNCCPPVETPAVHAAVGTAGGNNGKVLGIAIAGVAVFSLMALAIYYLRRRVSNAKDTQTNNAGSCIPTAVALNMDPETAEAPFSKGYPLPPPYAPHTSAPPPYAPHASAPPLE